MAGTIVEHKDSEPLVEYYPDTQALRISNGRPLGVGDDVAKDVVVFFDSEDESEVVGLYIASAEVVLKPFVEAILAKYGVPRVEADGYTRRGAVSRSRSKPHAADV